MSVASVADVGGQALVLNTMPAHLLPDRELLSKIVGTPAAAQLLVLSEGLLAPIFAVARREVDSFDGLGPDNRLCFQQNALDTLAAAWELSKRALHEKAKASDCLASPQAVRDFLRMYLRDIQHEVFLVIHLNATNHVIATEQLFRGTLSQCSVYPREIVKSALRFNAASILLSHNHPGGSPTPSFADRSLTKAVQAACAVVDVNVLDHVIVAGGEITSFAETGMMY